MRCEREVIRSGASFELYSFAHTGSKIESSRKNIALDI